MTTESIIDRIIYFFIENKIIEKDYLSNVLTNNQIEIDEYQFLELYNEIINSGLFEFKKENTKDSKDLLFIPNDKAQQKFKGNTSYLEYKKAKNKKENDKSNSVVISGSKNVNVIQGSDLRESEFHHIEKKYPNKVAATTQKESTIFQKILNLTNHQVIGGIIASILSAIIIWYFTKK